MTAAPDRGSMADSKLEIKVGSITFNGEGTGDWLSKQLDKVLAKIPELAAIQDRESIPHDGKLGETADKDATSKRSSGQRPSLATFLKERKAATGNQQRKFLAAAAWLQDGGAKRLSTRDVTTALSEHNQGKLKNAAQCLINLAKAGAVVREGKQFYVSDEGRAELRK